jgi:hypothetical protein
MANIVLADVTIHVDETLDQAARSKLENDLRLQDGVLGVQVSEKAPHLLVVSYDPTHTAGKAILKAILGEEGLHAETIG